MHHHHHHEDHNAKEFPSNPHRLVVPFFKLTKDGEYSIEPSPEESRSNIKGLLQHLRTMVDTTIYCRFTGIVSSMHYKLDEVLWEYNKFESAVTLAEGEGSGALLLIQKYGVKKLFLNTLATEHSIESEVISGYTTPRMLLPIMPKTHRGELEVILNNSASQITDITHRDWFSNQKNRIPNDADIITMDAETTENLDRSRLYEAVYTIICNHINPKTLKVVILKVFLSDLDGMCWINNYLAPMFGSGYLIKPITSSAKSSEWYLCLSNLLSTLRTTQHQTQANCLHVVQCALQQQVQRGSYWLHHLTKYTT
uniref:Methyltransferase domain of the L protein n=1 Tax=Sudan ebolavirus (strain Boniface-76) TaxID=128948 RepID=UPI00194ADA73|nr:Chain A, Methyltransferase domain of the L protein [Sudan virus - Boniface, Sudan,1976]